MLRDAPAAQALDLLSSLVDKSLVMKEDADGLACYRLHETMREFAGLKLPEAGEQEAVELRCAEYYRSTCQRSALEGRYRLPDWLAWADLEIDNVRAVLQRCLAHGDAARGVDLAASLGWYWITRATTEGIRWLDAFLAFEDRGNTPGRTAARRSPAARPPDRRPDRAVLPARRVRLPCGAVRPGPACRATVRRRGHPAR